MQKATDQLQSNPPIEGPSNRAGQELMTRVLDIAMTGTEAESVREARKIHNMAVDGERAKTKGQITWTGHNIQIPPERLFDTLGPDLSELWKKEVPFEQDTATQLKRQNAELQEKINAEYEVRFEKNKPLPLNGLYLVRMENGKEAECYKVYPKAPETPLELLVSTPHGKSAALQILAELEADLAKMAPWYVKAWNRVKGLFKK
jgi:hypothetical protein